MVLLLFNSVCEDPDCGNDRILGAGGTESVSSLAAGDCRFIGTVTGRDGRELVYRLSRKGEPPQGWIAAMWVTTIPDDEALKLAAKKAVAGFKFYRDVNPSYWTPAKAQDGGSVGYAQWSAGWPVPGHDILYFVPE